MNRGERFAAKQRGDWCYWTEKGCPHGHPGWRYTQSGKCIYCGRIRCGEWLLKNPQKAKDRQDRYNITHPEWYREMRGAIKSRYRARKAAAKGSYTVDDVKAIYSSQKGKCIYCREKLGKKYHVDHIMPLYLGGDNSRYNLQITCVSCNCSKGKRHPVDFAQSRGMLL